LQSVHSATPRNNLLNSCEETRFVRTKIFQMGLFSRVTRMLQMTWRGEFRCIPQQECLPGVDQAREVKTSSTSFRHSTSDDLCHIQLQSLNRSSVFIQTRRGKWIAWL